MPSEEKQVDKDITVQHHAWTGTRKRQNVSAFFGFASHEKARKTLPLEIHSPVRHDGWPCVATLRGELRDFFPS